MTQTKTKKKPKKPKSDHTSASLLILARYAKLNIRSRWDKKRVDRLCRFLNITRFELETLIGSKVERVDDGKILNMTTCLLLTLLESTYLRNYTKDVIQNIFNFS